MRPRRNWVACYLGRGLWGRLDEDDKLREPDQNLLILDFLLYFSVLIKVPTCGRGVSYHWQTKQLSQAKWPN